MDTHLPTDALLLDSYETARYLGLKNPGTLGNWRLQKKGPPYVCIGRNVRYLQSDLDTWIARQRVLPTSPAASSKLYVATTAA
jgi:predicted DNA-binding transcriptional regulator AlpA